MVLQMTYYILLTALTVSLDSFFCGFSLSNKKNNKAVIVLTIAITVLIMCLIANYSTFLFAHLLTEKTASLGGIILIAVGLFNLIKKDNDTANIGVTFRDSLLTGIAVGLDGALANLSLAMMGINSLYVPVLIAFCHAITIYLGIILSNSIFANKIRKYKFIAYLLLIGLGVYKLTGLF